MSKVKIHSVNPREKYQIIGEFFEIVAGLRSKKEVVDFFIGLLTPSEAVMMARRIQVAKKILQGKNYEEIRKELKVSYQTITKTENWLHNGTEEYDCWITKCLNDNNKKRITADGAKGLLDRYPGHRMLKKFLS